MRKIADRIRSGWLSHPRRHLPSHTAGVPTLVEVLVRPQKPIPSTVIPSFIPDATPRIPRPHQTHHVQFSHRKSPRKILDAETARHVVDVFPAVHVLRLSLTSCCTCDELSARELDTYKTCGGYSLFNACHGQGARPFLEESSHPQNSGIWETVGTWHPPSSQYAHFQPSTYTIPYPFLPRPVPAPNSSSRLALPGLTPASPVQKPPPSQSSVRPHRSDSLPVVVRRHYFATGKPVVATPSFARLSFVITGSNNPSVQSKVAPGSDSGPEPSVE
ncbi:hypothetical protein BU17DRAFT_78946 [Hysterangium stoloniferum]|nr:hypothetical protein BU17DRAFT_78946 [Hysterangium stoloniferum]